jgi:signal transduction histidine kinase
MDHSLKRFDPKSNGYVTDFPNDLYFAGRGCNAILEDHEVGFWFATTTGAWHYGLPAESSPPTRLISLPEHKSDGQAPLTHLGRQDGLSSDNVLCFQQDSDHNLWIGTDSGLDRYRNGVIRSVTTRQGLFENRIHCILEDDLGNFWIGCNHGIFRVSRQELNDVADGRAERVHCLVLGEADGLADSQIASEHQPVAGKGPDGRLWFATGRGVAFIDPRQLQPHRVSPPVVIEQVRIDDQVFGDPDTAAGPAPTAGSSVYQALPGEALRLSPGHGRFVEIRYTANSFVSPGKVRLEYWLDGYDSQWKPSPGDRIARYTNLRPGTYRFAVRAANSDGVRSEHPATCAFVLAPHLYESWPFYPICGLVLAGGALGLQRYRLKVQKHVLALKAQHALDLERARIARDIHDHLGAGLTGISLEGALLAQQVSGKAADQAGSLTRTARQLLESLNETVWAVNPAKDQPESFINYISAYAQRFLESAGIRCRLDLPEQTPALKLSSQLRHNLFLAFKEALHNVVKHARASEVVIAVSLSADSLKVSVSDNGVGCQARPSELGGNGLSNMRKRLQLIGGACHVESRPREGTRVRLSIRLN